MVQQPQLAPAVIVVEDDPILSVVLQRVLRQLTRRYEIVHVTDGVAALTHFEQRRVPLLITDYMLRSSMDGLKLTSTVRARSPETRVVLITAYATPEVEQSAAERGVEFYLPKPFLLQDLEQIVQTVLAVWQAQEQGS
jgi:two-component system response regulator (stage 0 sporulation protein F)